MEQINKTPFQMKLLHSMGGLCSRLTDNRTPGLEKSMRCTIFGCVYSPQDSDITGKMLFWTMHNAIIWFLFGSFMVALIIWHNLMGIALWSTWTVDCLYYLRRYLGKTFFQSHYNLATMVITWVGGGQKAALLSVDKESSNTDRATLNVQTSVEAGEISQYL